MKRFLVMFLMIITIAIVGCTSSDEAVAGEAFYAKDLNNLKNTNVKDLQRAANEGQLKKDDIFLLPAPANGATHPTVGQILEYEGSDKISRTNPKIKFEIWSTGEVIEYPIIGKQATIRLGGKTFTVLVLRPTIDDSPIAIDFDGDGQADKPQTVPLNYKVKNVGSTGFRCRQVPVLLVGESWPVLSTNSMLTLESVKEQTATVSIRSSTSTSTGGSGSAGVFEIYWGDQRRVDDFSIHLLNVLHQDYAGGLKQAAFCLN